MVPLFTEMSSTVKSALDSLVVNVKLIEESLVMLPSVTPFVVLVMVIVGAVLSKVQLN
jgi:hypothetical protein